MGINLGSLNIADVFLGSTQITAVYQGSNLIWQKGPVTDEPFWVSSDEAFDIQLTQTGTVNAVPEISTDQQSWMTLAPGYAYSYQAGQKVYVRNVASNDWSLNSSNYLRFSTGCTFKTVGGNAKSLINNSDTLTTYCFFKLFYNYGSLVDASELKLPWITLATYCYNNMFYSCTKLTEAPTLPAETLADYCYELMFCACSTLEIPPALQAMTVAPYCYHSMFASCSKLSTAPALPALTLANYCYQNMFYGCKALTTAPALPAETLANYCYNYMFASCTGLTTSPTVLPAKTLQSSCYSYMFSGCSVLTTVPSIEATIVTGNALSYMFSGCKALAQLPKLYAISLEYRCYMKMFNGCSLIKLSETQTGEYINEYRLPATGTGKAYTEPLRDMFTSTGGTFTGTPEINTTYYTSNEVIS